MLNNRDDDPPYGDGWRPIKPELAKSPPKVLYHLGTVVGSDGIKGEMYAESYTTSVIWRAEYA
jgi:hypothetical protein